MPYEEITKEQYETAISHLRPFQFNYNKSMKYSQSLESSAAVVGAQIITNTNEGGVGQTVNNEVPDKFCDAAGCSVESNL